MATCKPTWVTKALQIPDADTLQRGYLSTGIGEEEMGEMRTAAALTWLAGAKVGKRRSLDRNVIESITHGRERSPCRRTLGGRSAAAGTP